MLNEYKAHVDERQAQNIPPLPLDADQTSQLVDLLKSDHEESELLLHLLKERVPAGVDQVCLCQSCFSGRYNNR
jgi:aconitate hydratase 2/2-methylisocitrate dehydratase